jgi:phospholipid transport system substrate-binding protein
MAVRIAASVVVALGITLAAVVGARPAWAGPPTEQLRTQVERVIKVLENPDLKREGRTTERRAAIRRIANEIFDFNKTTRLTLGSHWQGRTREEREEIVGLFADLLERSYIGKIEMYSGERIQYVGDTIERDQATVWTRLVTKAGAEIPVEYHMHRAAGDRWLAYDVAIEGVSMVANYRAQFNKIIQTASYKALVTRLTAKQEEGLEADRELTIRKASSQPK